MAQFTFRRKDTGATVTFEANGQKYANARAPIAFGLRADQFGLVQLVKRTGQCHNGIQRHRRRSRWGRPRQNFDASERNISRLISQGAFGLFR